MKVVILFTGNFEIEGRVRHCEKGEILEVTEDDAARLIEALQAEKAEEVRSGRKNKQ